MHGAAQVRTVVWGDDFQSQMTTMLKKTRDHWRGGTSLTLANGVIVANYPRAPEGDRLAAEWKKWGDGHPFLAGWKGSTTLDGPGKSMLTVTLEVEVRRYRGREQQPQMIDREVSGFLEIRNGEVNLIVGVPIVADRGRTQFE
jgi:hypothetical protein